MSDLAQKVREQMLGALYEISAVIPPQSIQAEIKEEEGAPVTPAPVPEVAAPSVPSPPEPAPPVVEESKVEESSVPSTQAPLSIDTSARDLSEKGAETEEDEGMVLVGRPDTDSS